MRIAIYHNLPSGGGKRALFEITRRLAENHPIDTYTLSCANHDYCDIRPYSKKHNVFQFRAQPLARSPFGRINQVIRVLDIYRRRQVERQVANQIDSAAYDVVFVHNCQFGQSSAVLKYLHTPTVYFCGEPPRYLYEPKAARPYSESSQLQKKLDYFDPLPGLYKRTLMRVDREYTRSASLVLANSAYSRETIYRTYGIFSKVAYLGVDTDLFQPLSLLRKHYVISVGSTTPAKGYAFLIESLAQISVTKRPKLVIVSNYSDPQERAYLENLAKKQEVSVEFHSMISDNELVRMYNQAMLTVYAPVMEPFGFVPLESMACSTPVVGVREAGVRESVIHEVNGLLAERDPGEFARAVELLLCDPGYRDQLGHKGLAQVRENWRWETSINYIEQRLVDTTNTRRNAQ